MRHTIPSFPRRILSLWLPRIATDRFMPPDRGQPAVTVTETRGAMRIVAATAEAEALGIRPGMTLADARALHPPLPSRPADPEGDAALLVRLADACGRWSPVVALDPPDGLMLDLTGCDHLYPDEPTLIAQIRQRLEACGFSLRAGMAATPGAAWAFARFGAADAVLPAGDDLAGALSPLPVAGLRLPADTVAALAAVGLRRIGDLLPLPRAPLAARFGADLLRRLDQATGAAFEPVDPHRPPPAHRVRMELPEPVGHADLPHLLDRLLDALCARLARERLGVRRLELSLFRLDGDVKRAWIGTARPNRDPVHLARLLREPIGGLDLGLGVELAILSAVTVEPLAQLQGALRAEGTGAPDPERALAELVDRLRQRLGADAVHMPLPRASHLPERAQARITPFAPASAQASWPLPTPRPLRLLPRPEPLEVTALIPDHPPVSIRWRRILHRIARAEGPERIAPEWWRDGDSRDSNGQDSDGQDLAAHTRDYFAIETAEGRRLWVFREGLYETSNTRPGGPRWFVHGVFA